MLITYPKGQLSRYGLIVFLILVPSLYGLFCYINISRIAITFLILIVSIIFYNLWRIYKNETELITTSDKAFEFALAKSRFLASMSHEIRTPLNSVIGFSEQLSQSKLNAEQAAQLTAIRSSSTMVLDLVNDILDFAKYETNKASFEKISFAPFKSINEVVDIIAIQAAQRNIELKSDISFEETVCILGDSLRLKQLLMNLLSNAIKFTERGSVKLKADLVMAPGKQAILKVQVIDTGIGIEAMNLAMIFDEFAQVNYLPSTFKPKGTGLGLAICKKIVECQDGEIKVVSELGRGSVFSFSIPYELCDEQLLENRAITAIDLASLIGKRLLLADDNRMNVLLIRTVIDKYQITSDVAYDGQEAYNLFERNRYDLVLTDIQMPIMSGIALSKAIRLHVDLAKRDTTILGLTANVLPEDRTRYINAGMNDLVLKPFSEQELMEKIAIQFDRKKQV